MDADRLVARTREYLDLVPYLLLGTTDGVSVSLRQVQLLDVDDDLTIWFGTSPRSRKAHAIHRNREATVALEHFQEFGYASLRCDAELVTDRDECRARWRDDLRPIWPDGPAGGDFVLVRLVPRRIEILDFSEGITPVPYGLVPAAIERGDDGWQPVPHPRHDAPPT